jgi:hypothetical protein
MGWWFFSFWWLIFPIMGFGMGAFGMWMRYLRHRQTIELMKTYAAQGKDPAEVAKILGLGPGYGAYGPGFGPPPGAGPASGPAGGVGPAPGASPGPGPEWHDPWDGRWGGYWGGGWGGPWYGYRWGSRRWRRWSPYREWRSFVVFGCLALGFGMAAYYDAWPPTYHAFIIVAIIMGVLSLGSLMMAIISSVMMRPDPDRK